jgi:hypothetical protein
MLQKRRSPKGKRRSESILDGFRGRNPRDAPKTSSSKGKTTLWEHFGRIPRQEPTRCSKHVVFQRENDVLRAFWTDSVAGTREMLQKRRFPKGKRRSGSILDGFRGRNPRDAPNTSFSKGKTTFWERFGWIPRPAPVRCSKNAVFQRENDVLKALWTDSAPGAREILQKRRFPKGKRRSESTLDGLRARSPRDPPKTSFPNLFFGERIGILPTLAARRALRSVTRLLSLSFSCFFLPLASSRFRPVCAALLQGGLSDSRTSRSPLARARQEKSQKVET